MGAMQPPNTRGLIMRKKDVFYYYTIRHWGTDRTYLADDKLAARIESLTGDKTLTAQNLRDLEYLLGQTAAEIPVPVAVRQGGR